MTKAILRVGGRWAVSWMCVGIVGGLLLMLGKVPPIAESGHKPDEISWYSFWLPIMGLVGVVVGFALGVVYGSLMLASRPVRTKAGAATWAARNLPRLTCGFGAGAILGALAGPESAVLFGMLGLLSASLSGFDRIHGSTT